MKLFATRVVRKIATLLIVKFFFSHLTLTSKCVQNTCEISLVLWGGRGLSWTAWVHITGQSLSFSGFTHPQQSPLKTGSGELLVLQQGDTAEVRTSPSCACSRGPLNPTKMYWVWIQYIPKWVKSTFPLQPCWLLQIIVDLNGRYTMSTQRVYFVIWGKRTIPLLHVASSLQL